MIIEFEFAQQIFNNKLRLPYGGKCILLEDEFLKVAFFCFHQALYGSYSTSLKGLSLQCENLFSAIKFMVTETQSAQNKNRVCGSFVSLEMIFRVKCFVTRNNM